MALSVSQNSAKNQSKGSYPRKPQGLREDVTIVVSRGIRKRIAESG